MTPDILVKFGAPKLPLIVLQSTLTKCTRKPIGSRSAHELSRNIIETLPEQIANPIFLIQDNARNSIALISDTEDKSGNKILTAILLDTIQHKNRVNEIKSIYGKTNLKEYLQKHMEENQLNVIDSKKAEMLSRVLGLQLPMALITSSYDKNITLRNQKVNSQKMQTNNSNKKGKQSLHNKLKGFQKEIDKNNRKEHILTQKKQEYEK